MAPIRPFRTDGLPVGDQRVRATAESRRRSGARRAADGPSTAGRSEGVRLLEVTTAWAGPVRREPARCTRRGHREVRGDATVRRVPRAAPAPRRRSRATWRTSRSTTAGSRRARCTTPSTATSAASSSTSAPTTVGRCSSAGRRRPTPCCATSPPRCCRRWASGSTSWSGSTLARRGADAGVRDGRARTPRRRVRHRRRGDGRLRRPLRLRGRGRPDLGPLLARSGRRRPRRVRRSWPASSGATAPAPAARSTSPTWRRCGTTLGEGSSSPASGAPTSAGWATASRASPCPGSSPPRTTGGWR